MVVVPGDPAFAIGRFTVTVAEWDAAQVHPEWQKHSSIAPRAPNDHGWGRGKQPAIDVAWNDAKAYCAWLSAMTRKTYRLPSEADWELACRAGTKTEFWWGNEISTAQAKYNGNYKFGNGKKGEYRRRTVPVDTFEANPWGLCQVHGNVWEWCEDAFDGSSRVIRGGSWVDFPGSLRSSHRLREEPGVRGDYLGFRVARVLSPAGTLLPP
jgi:formylglycine-generating enzyme required for sulfatase activity